MISPPLWEFQLIKLHTILYVIYLFILFIFFIGGGGGLQVLF